MRSLLSNIVSDIASVKTPGTGTLPKARRLPRIGSIRYIADMDPQIPEAVYGDIEAMIDSEASPVGIDAKKTHVIIIHKLLQIEQRLERLERLAAGKGT